MLVQCRSDQFGNCRHGPAVCREIVSRAVSWALRDRYAANERERDCACARVRVCVMEGTGCAGWVVKVILLSSTESQQRRQSWDIIVDMPVRYD